MRLLHGIAIFQTVKSKVIISLFKTVRLSVSISLRNFYNSLNSIKESVVCCNVYLAQGISEEKNVNQNLSIHSVRQKSLLCM